MAKIGRLGVLLFVAWCVSAVGRAADGPTVEVGLARREITPTFPVRLTGYSNRKTEFESVYQPLWAKALAIGSDADGPALLMTVDLLGVPATLTDELAARLKNRCGLKPERLAICASHTHTGPALAGMATLIFVGEITAEELGHIERYTRQVVDHLEAVALAALADRRPCRLAWAEGQLGFAVNRRVLKEGRWTGFGETPTGPVDHSLPLIRITAADGTLRGVLVNYACHCTTLTGSTNQVGGDWAGYAQEFIERAHPGVVAMITIGCGADANPTPRGELAHAQQHGRALAEEVRRLLAEPLAPLPGTVAVATTTIDLPFAPLPTREEFAARAKQKGPIAYHAQVNLARLDRGEALPTSQPFRAAAWSFGQELAMVFLAGEVTVDYALRLKRELGGRRLWITAYANDAPCYIASRRVLAEGGYEVDGSMYYYDKPQHFVPEIEDLIVGKVVDLVGKR